MENRDYQFRLFLFTPALTGFVYFAGDEGKGFAPRTRAAAMIAFGLLSCWLVYPYFLDNMREAWSRMTKGTWTRIESLWRAKAFGELLGFVKPFAVFLCFVALIAGLTAYTTYSYIGPSASTNRQVTAGDLLVVPDKPAAPSADATISIFKFKAEQAIARAEAAERELETIKSQKAGDALSDEGLQVALDKAKLEAKLSIWMEFGSDCISAMAADLKMTLSDWMEKKITDEQFNSRGTRNIIRNIAFFDRAPKDFSKRFNSPDKYSDENLAKVPLPPGIEAGTDQARMYRVWQVDILLLEQFVHEIEVDFAINNAINRAEAGTEGIP